METLGPRDFGIFKRSQVFRTLEFSIVELSNSRVSKLCSKSFSFSNSQLLKLSNSFQTSRTIHKFSKFQIPRRSRSFRFSERVVIFQFPEHIRHPELSNFEISKSESFTFQLQFPRNAHDFLIQELFQFRPRDWNSRILSCDFRRFARRRLRGAAIRRGLEKRPRADCE